MSLLERLEILFDENDTRDVVKQLLAEAWEEGWSACEKANCDNCYSCGAWVGDSTNPYREVAE